MRSGVYVRLALDKVSFAHILRLFAVATVILFIGLNGCSNTVPKGEVKRTPDGELVRLRSADDMAEAEKTRLRQNLIREAKDGLTRYRLSPGDTLEVMYHLSLVSETQAYRIGVNDELNIDFFYQPRSTAPLWSGPTARSRCPLRAISRRPA